MDKWQREELHVAIKRIDEWMIGSQTKRKRSRKVKRVPNDNRSCVFTQEC